MRTAALFIALVFSMAAISVHEASAQSVGFFPSTIEIENGLRGQEYEVKTTLVNQSDEARVFTVSASGDTAPWIAFAMPDTPSEPVQQVDVPAKSETELLVTVTVPEAAPNGDVTGKNSFDGYTESAFASRSGVVTGFDQPVHVKVTGDQVIDLRVGDVSARTVEVGQPLQIAAQLSNQGNVDTAPELTVDVYAVPGDANDAPLDTVSGELDVVPPGQSRTPVLEWPTNGRDQGQYRAEYAVTLDGDRLALGSFDFELKPAGSIAAQGNIVSVDLVRPVVEGAVNRADVTFENTGDVAVHAQFTGHIYKGDAALSEAATPDYLSVAPGERVVLSAYFELPEGSAEYELRGRAYFDGAETDEVAIPFAAGSSGEPQVTRMLALGGGSVAAIGALALAGAWVMKRRA